MSDSSSQDERRTTDRLAPVVDPTYVWISVNKRIRAQVSDESDDGIGIEVDKEFYSHFERGFQVRIQHGDLRRTATIAYVGDCVDSTFRVGLEWAE